jgi:hypothetical protein
MRTACPGSTRPQATKRSAPALSAAAGTARRSRSNTDRSTQSIFGPRPSGGNSSPTEASASP